ncbi:MAG: superoxide dismutase family protein [Allosphingosinicella sp.]
MKLIHPPLLAALALGACTAATTVEPAPRAAAVAAAEIHEPGGRAIGRASVEAAGDSVRVRIETDGLGVGSYGVHLHAVGRCDPPAFASAGPHWNPAGRQHGKDNPKGMHMGDLPNLVVGNDRRGGFEQTIPGASLAALLDADGAAIVVHAAPDDYRTDPSGNSGARIACGVLVLR